MKIINKTYAIQVLYKSKHMWINVNFFIIKQKYTFLIKNKLFLWEILQFLLTTLKTMNLIYYEMYYVYITLEWHKSYNNFMYF